MADPFATLGIAKTMDRQAIHRAYRALARRWHPDRFAPGPERMWAEGKMTEINSAYAECLSQLPACACSERDCLDSAIDFLAKNQPGSARRVLMGASCRTAEWNYLFGRALSMLGEAQKAATYLSVAAHQQPDNQEYQRAWREEEEKLHGKRKASIRKIFVRGN